MYFAAESAAVERTANEVEERIANAKTGRILRYNWHKPHGSLYIDAKLWLPSFINLLTSLEKVQVDLWLVIVWGTGNFFIPRVEYHKLQHDERAVIVLLQSIRDTHGDTNTDGIYGCGQDLPGQDSAVYQESGHSAARGHWPHPCLNW